MPPTPASHAPHSPAPKLTTLPQALQSRILEHLCDPEIYEKRGSLRGSNYCFPFRYPNPEITLDGVDDAHPPLPSEFLAPALASPTLADAAASMFFVSYLTELNTEGLLPLWVKAFAKYVQAVSAGHIADVAKSQLSRNLRGEVVERLRCDTVELFSAITENHVRLKVLDLVHVPFYRCEGMEDAMMAGLCAALESNQTTLKELALPVYPKSDLCANALETVDLPHLVVLSVELRHVSDPFPFSMSMERKGHLRRPFLRMMQAVDGHADRAAGVTTLEELRLLNLYCVPCTNVRESGCSAGFFHAVRTLRAGMSETQFGRAFDSYSLAEDSDFFLLFRKLECLYWNAMPPFSHDTFERLFKRLKEVHFCHWRWIRGVQVGSDYFEGLIEHHPFGLWDTIEMSCKKIVTLVTYSELFEIDFSQISQGCPNLKHLSLHITPGIVHGLHGLIEDLRQLTSLEIIIADCLFDPLGKNGWEALGKAIPRRHANLRNLAIQTRFRFTSKSVPLNIVIDCFVNVVKRLGRRAERLVLRANVKCIVAVRLIKALCRLLYACEEHARGLTYLEIDIVPCKRWKVYDSKGARALELAKRDLNLSKTMLMLTLHRLTKLDLGYLHHLSV